MTAGTRTSGHQSFIAPLSIIARRRKGSKCPPFTDEQNMVYTYGGIPFGQGKEWDFDKCYKWVNLKIVMLSEIS